MNRMAFAAAIVAASFAARAATNEVAELPPVVVYASRIGDTAERMAAPVRVFGRDEIASSGARDLAELLEKKANLQVRVPNSHPLQTQIAMRGFGENSFGRVKVLVDGEELNGADMEPPNLVRIPIGNVERVEVIGGPSPVLYGDGAIAGVINVITDSHDYSAKSAVAARGGSYGTFGGEVRTRGGIEAEGLLYSGSYGYVRSDGYRDRSAYDMHSAVAGVRRNFANGSTAGLRANYFNALYEMPGALSYGQWQADRRQARYDNDWCRQWNFGFAADAKALLADDQWLYLDGVFSLRHRRTSWGDYGYANEYDLYGYQLSPRYVNEVPVWDFDNKLTMGFDFRFERYDVEDNSGYNNHEYAFDRLRYAPYAHDEFFLTDELSLVVGARLEVIDNRWHGYRGLTEERTTDIADDYEIGLVYRPVDGLKTFAKGTRFHRSAFCDELNYTENGEFLSPETGTSLDVGLDWTFAEEFSFDLAGYWTVMEDEIFYNPHAKDYGGGYWGGYNCNSPGKTGRLGFETGLGWLRDKVAEASVRYGFVDARFLDGQYESGAVPLVPESRVRVEAGWWPIDDLELKGGYRYVAPQVLAGDFGNEHEKLSGYSLFDLGLHYEPGWAEGWKASFVIDNLFDIDYCDFAGWSDYSGAYYYPACARSFMFTIGYEF